LAAVFDQPPTYYTIDSNLANLQAADEQHAKQAVEPRCKAIAGTLTNLVRMWDERLFFSFDPPLAEDEESRMKVVQMRLNSGLTTINQENEEARWPKVPYGDQPWLPGTVMQPSMLMQKHEQSLKQGAAALKQSAASLKQGEANIESQRRRDKFELRDDPLDVE
jgi:hypothetical protein